MYEVVGRLTNFNRRDSSNVASNILQDVYLQQGIVGRELLKMYWIKRDSAFDNMIVLCEVFGLIQSIGKETNSEHSFFFVPFAEIDEQEYQLNHEKNEMHSYPIHFYLFYPEFNTHTWVFMFYGLLLREMYKVFELLDRSFIATR